LEGVSMSEEEIIKRLKELKEEGAILGEDEVKTLLNLIEKKDKIIDLMAEFIKKRNSSDVIDYCNTENCTYEKTYCDTSCIKEYFRKKVENDN
jgi:hypothetical protein